MTSTPQWRPGKTTQTLQETKLKLIIHTERKQTHRGRNRKGQHAHKEERKTRGVHNWISFLLSVTQSGLVYSKYFFAFADCTASRSEGPSSSELLHVRDASSREEKQVIDNWRGVRKSKRQPKKY